MARILFVISFLCSGCATANKLSPQYALAEQIIRADKIEVTYNGKNSNATATTSSWPETFKFLGSSIAQDGK